MVLQAMESNQTKKAEFKVPVGISARHIHLTQEHVEKLFGKGYQLTKKKELMGGQFASNEQCTIVGLKLRAIENVRILGPVRPSSQVEISATDARTLGIKAPTRQSGDTAGSAPIALVGPKGAIYLEEGCIVAARHIHLCPEDAAAAGLKDNDFVTVRMGNERGALLDNVKIRVHESFTTEMHIDTDEANACQVKQDELAAIML
ncbi:MAG: phosphate propanoyltransferase [Lachnospiraceae bacterium]|nr:phosphate propanoyltransferase [Lachnospiraceae bacterium]